MATPTAAIIAPLAGGQLYGSEKRKDVQEILILLDVNFKKTSFPPPEHNEILERLRIHTTSLDDLDPLITRHGISILCRYGFDAASPITRRIALRCLCNALFLAEPARQMFVDEGYPKEASELMKACHAPPGYNSLYNGMISSMCLPFPLQPLIQLQNNHLDDQFLSARLLLLCTYGTNLNFGPLFEKHNIAETINTNTSRNVRLITSTTEGSLSPANAISACSESLKLLYNLTAYYPHQVPHFSESLLPILKMLNNVPISSPPLQPPVSTIINSLVQLDLEDKKAKYSTRDSLFPLFDSNINVNRLAHILDLAIRAYSDEEIDQFGSPLVQVLLRVAQLAPPGPKEHLRALLLPSNQDRDAVLGTGDSLPARLLRLSATPTAPHLRELIPTLLFELSDKDAKKFVHNVGYGFASGFLFSNGIQPPSSALEASSSAELHRDNTDRSRDRSNAQVMEIDEEDERGNNTYSIKEGTESFEVNPITGQRRDMEPRLHTPEMTDEEKEREAERLFVLFERLRATGVMDVENPVAQALREGRFEEVD